MSGMSELEKQHKKELECDLFSKVSSWMVYLDLSWAETVALGWIVAYDAHGMYMSNRRFAELMGWNPNRGGRSQANRVLNSLVEKGLVRKSGGDRRTNTYRIDWDECWVQASTAGWNARQSSAPTEKKKAKDKSQEDHSDWENYESWED